jgi:hypothetical protein
MPRRERDCIYNTASWDDHHQKAHTTITTTEKNETPTKSQKLQKVHLQAANALSKSGVRD